MKSYVYTIVISAAILGASVDAEEVLNFEVTQQGVYQVSYQALQAYGLDIEGQAVADLVLSNQGSAVPIEVRGSDADPSVFGLGGHIRFVGKGVDTLYTDTNVYTLELQGSVQGARSPTKPLFLFVTGCQ